MSAQHWSIRLCVGILLMVSIFLVPWYIVFALAMCCALYYPYYIEWIVIAYVLDSFFAISSISGFSLWFTSVALAGVLGIIFIRRMMM